MPILYSVVSRGITILAYHATCAGNFEEVTEIILSQIPPENNKMTYSQGPYLFHYICEDSIIYMCITDDVCKHFELYIILIFKCFNLCKYHTCFLTKIRSELCFFFYFRTFKDPEHSCFSMR